MFDHEKNNHANDSWHTLEVMQIFMLNHTVETPIKILVILYTMRYLFPKYVYTIDIIQLSKIDYKGFSIMKLHYKNYNRIPINSTTNT
jgi:hypothetical protein